MLEFIIKVAQVINDSPDIPKKGLTISYELSKNKIKELNQALVDNYGPRDGNNDYINITIGEINFEFHPEN